jgi:hypothetical protein
MTPGAATVENTTMDTPVVRNITIPPEALEAAAKAIADLSCPPDLFGQCEAAGGCMCRAEARAACLAMLNAWPGRKTENRDGWNWTDTGAVTTHRYEALILPLPKEPTDDK